MPKIAENRKAPTFSTPDEGPQIELQGRHFKLALPLGFGRPMPSQGGPVYEETARPQRKALTTYAGQMLVKLDVPILLDSTKTTRKDRWPIVEQILGLTRPPSPGLSPPDFTIKGPIPFSGLRCQMEWPEFLTEPEPWVLHDGRTIRQALILKLVEFQNPDPLSFQAAKRSKNEGSVSAAGVDLRFAEVEKQGETLVQLAARVLGDAGRAKEIGQLNGIRDVREKLDRGRHLALPTAEL